MPDLERDLSKDRANQVKHAVAFERAQQAFLDPFWVIAEDLGHGEESGAPSASDGSAAS